MKHRRVLRVRPAAAASERVRVCLPLSCAHVLYVVMYACQRARVPPPVPVAAFACSLLLLSALLLLRWVVLSVCCTRCYAVFIVSVLGFARAF